MFDRFPVGARHDGFKTVDRHSTTYWSGNDLEVFFNDVHMGQLIQIGHNIVERVTPSFHYSDWTATRIDHGTRIVTGEFTVNLKRFDDVLAVLQHDPEPVEIPKPTIPSMTLTSDDVENMTPEGLAAFIAKSREFKSELEVGAGAMPTVSPSSPLYRGRRPLTIYIVCGGQIEQSNVLEYSEAGYGVRATNPTERRTFFVGTGRAIVDVHIMGESTVQGDDGRGFVTTYQFMARDIQPMRPDAVARLAATQTSEKETS